MDPFQIALDAIFTAPGSSAATYFPVDGDPVPIRLILSRPDEVANFRGSSVVQATYQLSIRRSEVPAPQSGDFVQIEGGEFPQLDGVFTDRLNITGDPMLDVEGITWTCGAEPIP